MIGKWLDASLVSIAQRSPFGIHDIEPVITEELRLLLHKIEIVCDLACASGQSFYGAWHSYAALAKQDQSGPSPESDRAQGTRSRDETLDARRDQRRSDVGDFEEWPE
jgi:hypothetical protein